MHETSETELPLRSVGPNAGAERSSLTNYHEYIREQRILTNIQLMHGHLIGPCVVQWCSQGS